MVAREVKPMHDKNENQTTESTARRLSLVALRNWENALTGLVALPAAIALSTAAATLFTLALLERAFEMTELGLADVGKRVGGEFDAHGNPREVIQARPS
jgi:hypothetical protein